MDLNHVNSAHFTALPTDILDHIFQYLNYEDLLHCKAIAPDLQELCNKYMIKSFISIEKEIHNCMEILNNQINGSNLKFKEKRKLLRTFNILENLKHSIDLYLTLKRPDIGHNVSYSLAQIFDNSKNLIDLIKTNPFNINKLHLASLWMQSDITDVLNKAEDTNFTYIGVRIVDYLDLMLQIHYNINVTYNTKENICSINGFYYLKHSKLLFYLPDIPFMKSCSERPIADEEQLALMKYLALLVNVHNRLIIKTEQTKRDLELSRWELLTKKTDKPNEDKKWLQNFWKIKNKRYNSSRNYLKRTKINNDNEIINETYSNCDHCNHDEILQGMKCTINLECRIEDAPLQIIKSYKRLQNELFKIDVHKNGEMSVNKTETSEDIYTFNLKLEINLSTKHPDILELHFNHSNQNN